VEQLRLAKASRKNVTQQPQAQPFTVLLDVFV